MIMLRFRNKDISLINSQELTKREKKIRDIVSPNFLANFLGRDYENFGLNLKNLHNTLLKCNINLVEENFNFIETITDARGNVYTCDYNDINGNLESLTLPSVETPTGSQQPVYEFTYNSYGQVEEVNSPDKIITRYEYYDDAGNLRQHYWRPGSNGGQNVYWILNRTSREDVRHRVIGMADLRYEFMDG